MQRNHTALPTSLQAEKKTTQELSQWCHMMLFCLSALRICTHAVYWKGHRLWLLSHWEPTCHTADMTLFECSVYMWSELQQAQMTKWLGVSKQPTNRPVLSQTGSWEQQRRCLVSSASSARCLITATMSDGVRNSTLDGCFDFSLCDTSVACHVALRLSASWARPGQMRLSSFCPCLQTGLALTNRPAWYASRGRSGGLMRHYVHLCGWCHKPSIPPRVCGA